MPIAFLSPAACAGRLSLCDAAGEAVTELQEHRYDWHCADGRLQTRVWSSAPIAPLTSESSEPLIGALARQLQAHAAPAELLVVDGPSRHFGGERAALLRGVRLLRLEEEADEACLDACWRVGVAAYGISAAGRLRLDALASRPGPGAWLMALLYGHFLTGACEVIEEWQETPLGYRWRCREPVTVAILDATGFEVDRCQGAAGEWQKAVPTGIYRALIESAQGVCYGQPRILHRPQAAA